MVARGTRVVLMDLCQELGSLKKNTMPFIKYQSSIYKPVSNDDFCIREGLLNLLPVEDGGHITHCSAPP